MKSINKVILIGNLTRDPEVNQVSSDTEVAKFSLAINESYKKPDGQMVESVTYIDCEAWSGLSKVVQQYLHKGSKVYVEGKLKADNWVDADTGKNRTKYKVRINDLLMLDSKRDGDWSENQSQPQTSNKPKNKQEETKSQFEDEDDELPF
jgi:single-strand DNA-binding protein